MVDRDDGRTEALDDSQRELGAAAAQVEHVRMLVEREQVEHALDLRRRDWIAVIVVAVRDAAELVRIHRGPCSRWGAFHGATRKSNAMPGSASTVQRMKNVNHPVCSTTHPVDALTTVRGTAASAVNSANCVAV